MSGLAERRSVHYIHLAEAVQLDIGIRGTNPGGARFPYYMFSLLSYNQFLCPAV